MKRLMLATEREPAGIEADRIEPRPPAAADVVRALRRSAGTGRSRRPWRVPAAWRAWRSLRCNPSFERTARSPRPTPLTAG
jgi:hypothetical protein